MDKCPECGGNGTFPSRADEPIRPFHLVTCSRGEPVPLPTYEGHPYTAVQALAASMIKTGLRPDAALHRAETMQSELLAMGYELVAVELIR